MPWMQREDVWKMKRRTPIYIITSCLCFDCALVGINIAIGSWILAALCGFCAFCVALCLRGVIRLAVEE